MDRWLGLMIGNSRLHWAYCCQSDSQLLIQQAWDSLHLSEETLLEEKIRSATRQADVYASVLPNLPNSLPPDLKRLLSAHPMIPLLVASVVPEQTQYWLTHANVRLMTLSDIDLGNVYPTLGIDRALAVFGAWHDHQTATLVIDGGTALTFTGVNPDGKLMGGAILPGLRLQLQSLHQQTAELPEVGESGPLPSRWQMNTIDAIRSGVWYGLLAGVQDFIHDWLYQYPRSVVVFTGGDGVSLWEALKGTLALSCPVSNIIYDPHVSFKGMAAIGGGLTT